MESIKPGRYRHFKGKEYEVLGVARHSETEEELVVYRALYGDFGLWVRPVSMWNETVERDGKTWRTGQRPSDQSDEARRIDSDHIFKYQTGKAGRSDNQKR